MLCQPRRVGDLRPSTGGDQYPIRRDFTPANKNAVGPANNAATFNKFNTGIRQQRAVDALKTIKLPVLGGNKRRPVMTINLYLPAVTACILELGRKGRAVHQELFRNAAANDTGASGAAFFNHRDTGPVPGRNARGPDTAGTGTDHDQVIVIGHGGSPERVLRP